MTNSRYAHARFLDFEAQCFNVNADFGIGVGLETLHTVLGETASEYVLLTC
jgi:hypothetical protein